MRELKGKELAEDRVGLSPSFYFDFGESENVQHLHGWMNLNLLFVTHLSSSLHVFSKKYFQ